MPITPTGQTSCDNPACPVTAGKQKHPTGVTPDSPAGWLVADIHAYGQPPTSHVYCGTACAAEHLAARTHIRDASALEGDPGDKITVTGQGFKGVQSADIGGV